MTYRSLICPVSINRRTLPQKRIACRKNEKFILSEYLSNFICTKQFPERLKYLQKQFLMPPIHSSIEVKSLNVGKANVSVDLQGYVLYRVELLN